MNLNLTEFSIVEVILKMNEEKIQRERNRIESRIEKIDYNYQLLELSLYENIFDEDISLLKEVKTTISGYCRSKYEQNNELMKDYHSKKEKMKKLFDKKIFTAIEIVNQNINSIRKCCLNKEENETYRSSIQSKKEFYFNKEIVSDYYKKFNEIKQILEK